MNNYLLTLVIKKELEEKERTALLDSVKKQAEVVTEDLWGVRTLAYPIKHQTTAFYAHYQLKLEPEKVSSLDKSLKLNEDIIRYLLIRK